VLAAIIGILVIIKPYINHIIKPISSMIIVGRERSFVCFVLIVLKDCGRYANVVKNAAARPIIVGISKYYCICSLIFSPASLLVLVVICRLPLEGSVFMYLKNS
jgi:hypothetical protein